MNITEAEFDEIVDNATHAVNDLIPGFAIAQMGDNEHSGLLTAINDALTPILRDAIEAHLQIVQDAAPSVNDAPDHLSLPASTNTETRRFDILVTRGATESCAMVVEADDPVAAHRHALERAHTDPDLVWELDEDTPGANSEISVTHFEEITDNA